MAVHSHTEHHQAADIATRLETACCESRNWLINLFEKQMLARFRLWAQVSRERDQLARMNDAALRDIGLTRADVSAELRKPFHDVGER